MTVTLADLPSELLNHVFSYLSDRDLASLTTVSRWCSTLALAILWHEVDLEDCRTGVDEDDCNADEHDDTRIVHKLLTITRNDAVAQHVHIINHGCHQQSAWVLYNLDQNTFAGQTVSYDPRLMTLVLLASQRVPNLHTLRIVQGHPRLVEALLRCFFSVQRQKHNPIRRLWLESCQLTPSIVADFVAHQQGLPSQLDFSGLESLRLRRLPLPAHTINTELLRGTVLPVMCRGSSSGTLWDELSVDEAGRLEPELLTRYYAQANTLDDAMFEKLSSDLPLPQAVSEAHIASHAERARWAFQHSEYDLHSTPAACSLLLLQRCSSTLTSLTFDWAVTKSLLSYSINPHDHNMQLHLGWLKALFRLRFPALRAFQFRNCMEEATTIDSRVNLLDKCTWSASPTTQAGDVIVDNDEYLLLEFLEAHSQLQCLAWPMDRFFADPREAGSRNPRVDAVIHNLGHGLTDLRLETSFWSGSQSHSDLRDGAFRRRRRRFIEELAPKFTNLVDVKMTGGIPFDERREVLRALGDCSLRRISMISQQSSIGNSWGLAGVAYDDLLHFSEKMDLPAEDETAIRQLSSQRPRTKLPPFEAFYGWEGQPAMMTTICDYHRESIRELKLIGEKGAAAVFNTSSITHAMLAGLKYCHSLRSLTLSLWVSTLFEEQSCSEEIVEYWSAASSMSTTALALPLGAEETGNTFQAYLNRLQPKKLAEAITELLGRHLSDTCLRQAGGLFVRASLHVAPHIFDLDIHIGLDAAARPCLLKHEEIRNEENLARRRQQLGERRWF